MVTLCLFILLHLYYINELPYVYSYYYSCLYCEIVDSTHNMLTPQLDYVLMLVAISWLLLYMFFIWMIMI